MHNKLLMFRIYIPLLLLGLFLSGCSAQGGMPEFDSSNAFSLLQKQCDFGPRPVGTEAHRQTHDFLAGELRKYTEAVEVQSFRRDLHGREAEFYNIIARFGGIDTPGILLCAHWDTRPTADEELEAADRGKPILGANDGASGVAVLLELARMFKEKAPPTPVTIVLFDGEDYGPGDKDMFIGSRYFASKLKEMPPLSYGILLDMVGDKDLQIYREAHSERSAKPVNDVIWRAAAELGYGNIFIDRVKYSIYDDHLPLIHAGLPCVDIIDFDYAYWHTLKDTPDKCSPQSLKIVGQTVARVVYSGIVLQSME